MITAAIALTAIAAYLWYGLTRYAPHWLETTIERHIADTPDLYTKPGRIEQERREEAKFAIMIGLVWPFTMAARALTRNILGRTAPSSVEARQIIAERDKYIRELEHQLGIERTDP